MTEDMILIWVTHRALPNGARKLNTYTRAMHKITGYSYLIQGDGSVIWTVPETRAYEFQTVWRGLMGCETWRQ